MFFFFISLVFLNLFIYYNDYLFLAFLFICLCFLGKKNDLRLFIISVICLGIFLFFNINNYNFSTSNEIIDKKVYVLEKYDSYSIVGNSKEKYLIYNNDYKFYKGSQIYVHGKINSIKESYNSFYKYLNKKGVNYEIDYSKVYVLDNNLELNEEIINKLLEDKSETSKSYLKLILFNVKDENNKEFYNTFSVYSLTYLIAVSGFHIRLLLSFFKKLFKINFIGYIFVCFYLYLLDFSVSSYRAFLYYVFKKINKKFKFNLSSNDILSLIGSAFIFINPSVMFSYSFIFSFLTTFVLEIFRLYSKKTVFITFYIYLINIPLMLLNYYKLNLSTILFSSILSLPISILYIFSFMFLFLDKFYLLYEFVIWIFNKLFIYLNNLNLVLIFGKPSVVFIILYFLVLLMFFIFKERRRKIRFLYLIMIFSLLGYQYFKPLINNNEQVYFLNVGQGDCTVFIIPNSKEAILLDTGGSKYSDVATSKIIPFLESKGVNKIRKVIISHDDFDHNGALSSLKENFNVSEVLETSNIKEIKIGNKNFINLNVNENRDNDGSLVLYGQYAGHSLLLMGDASIGVENRIVKEINKVDILKVGHHGSNTSSGEEFLSKIDGKFAIISVGKNNSYGHPHEEVIENLYRYKYIVFRTDENDTIGFGKNLLGISFIDYYK